MVSVVVISCVVLSIFDECVKKGKTLFVVLVILGFVCGVDLVVNTRLIPMSGSWVVVENVPILKDDSVTLGNCGFSVFPMIGPPSGVLVVNSLMHVIFIALSDNFRIVHVCCPHCLRQGFVQYPLVHIV